MKPFLNVYSQGEIVEIEKAIVPSERAWKADQENGMVCYISMKTSRYEGLKICENAESAVFSLLTDFQSFISWKVFIEI